MRPIYIAAIILCAATAAATVRARESPPPKPVGRVFLNPLTTDAATVEDLKRGNKEAVCVVGQSTMDLLQLCRDKGFKSVNLAPAADTVQSRAKANKLKLKIVDTSGSKTKTDS